MDTIYWTVSDIWVLTHRNILRYLRLPQLLVFSTIQPVMFVLLFAYVFGGAVKTPGVSYIDYLIPGILVQSVIFGAIQTGIGLADDLQRGMIDRFNSLPMSKWAVLAGRVLSDCLRNVFVIILMIGVGYSIGFRVQTGILELLFALLLLLTFGIAFSWVSANIGLLARDTETAQVGGFIWVFPLVFASSIFVPIETMPEWLKIFAENSPITAAVDAVRGLVLGGITYEQILRALFWTAGITLVFAPLAVFRYRTVS